MRHIGTVLAALVIAPLAWLLLSFGQAASLKAADGSANGGAIHPHDFLRPLLFLAAAGILLGIIATLRFSPLGAVLTGIAYLGSYALLLAGPQRLLDSLPHNVSLMGIHADATTPLKTGTAALAGAMMLIALVSGGRWRRWPGDEPSSEWGSSFGTSTSTSPLATSSPEPWENTERQPSDLTSWTTALRR
jgi:hypothetical protein